MKTLPRLLLTAALGIAACPPATAQSACPGKNYSLNLAYDDVEIDDVDEVLVCKDTPKSLFGLLNDNAFRKLIPSYNTSSSDPDDRMFNASIYFNGIDIDLSLYSANGVYYSSLLDDDITGIYAEFETDSFDESLRLLVDFLKHNKDLRKWVDKHQAQETPNSPIAGPTGLIPSSVTTGYDSAIENTLSEITGNDAGTPLPMNFAASYGHMRLGGREANVATLPLSHTWRSNSKKGRMFNLSGSLVHVKQAGATTYQGDLGASYRLPVTKRWALTPSLRYAVSHSDDLIFATGVASAGLSSTYHIPFRKLDVVVGNMVSYHRTTDVIDLGKYTYDPKIESWSARNGIMLAQPVNFFGAPLSLEYSLADTRYFGGTDFYVDNTQEIGISIGTNRRADVSKKYIRFGLRYLHGRETHGFTMTGNYWF